MKLFPVLFGAMVLMACAPQKTVVQGQPQIFERPDAEIPAPRPEPRPGFQTLDTIEDTILLDLQNLSSDRERRDSRYFVGCDRANLGQDVKEFEQGMDRGINQLSLERDLYKLPAIGPANCIYRVDLSEIGWTAQDWRILEDNDILNFVSQTIRNQNIQFLTQTRRPYLYGDSAMVTAYEADAVAAKKGNVYYRLIKQNPNTVLFFQEQGIDRQRQVNDEDALFAGFSQSQIALGKTRLVAMFDSREGVCISTYDTRFGGDDLFKNPFSIELARAGKANNEQNTPKVFRHDAQEHICTLPNGLFGLYRLNNAQDLAEVVAPADVVTNINGAKIDPSIRIGDCSNCHYKESVSIPFRDQLRAHVLGNGAFNATEKNIGRIFFDYDQITAKMDELNRSHTRAMQQLGITATQDPLWNTVTKPLREEMTIDQIASKTFLDTAEFKLRLQGAAVSSQVFGNILSGGTVSLAVFAANFRTLQAELLLFTDSNL